jgi:hypothetical protein
MRHLPATTLCFSILLLSACSVFQAKQPTSPPVVPKQLAVPVGKNWQVIEEAPTLTNERHERTLPLQSEQSIQPPGAPPATPTDQRKIETPR